MKNMDKIIKSYRQRFIIMSVLFILQLGCLLIAGWIHSILALIAGSCSLTFIMYVLAQTAAGLGEVQTRQELIQNFEAEVRKTLETAVEKVNAANGAEVVRIQHEHETRH